MTLEEYKWQSMKAAIKIPIKINYHISIYFKIAVAGPLTQKLAERKLQ